MKQTFRIFVALGLLLLFGAPARAQSSLKDLSWLAGCWEGKDSNREFSEQWMKPGGNIMLGTGRTILKGKKLQYEFMRIKQEDSGEIHYIPKPSGQQEASFKLISVSGGKFTFSNPEHDFPQRIIYGLEKRIWLVARIEGTINGKLESEDYRMKRVPCEANK
jgi:hypothetical protein